MSDEPHNPADDQSIPSAPSVELPREGRVAGVDFGTVRIGLAVSDPGQRLSSPLENYRRQGETQDAEYFQRVVAEELLVGFVVGLPVHMSGDESEKSREARAFGKWLAEMTKLPVVFHDERFSSTLADDMMSEANVRKKSRKQRRDAIAAHVILSNYLEWNSNR